MADLTMVVEHRPGLFLTRYVLQQYTRRSWAIMDITLTESAMDHGRVSDNAEWLVKEFFRKNTADVLLVYSLIKKPGEVFYWLTERDGLVTLHGWYKPGLFETDEQFLTMTTRDPIVLNIRSFECLKR